MINWRSFRRLRLWALIITFLFSLFYRKIFSPIFIELRSLDKCNVKQIIFWCTPITGLMFQSLSCSLLCLCSWIIEYWMYVSELTWDFSFCSRGKRRALTPMSPARRSRWLLSSVDHHQQDPLLHPNAFACLLLLYDDDFRKFLVSPSIFKYFIDFAAKDSIHFGTGNRVDVIWFTATI